MRVCPVRKSVCMCDRVERNVLPSPHWSFVGLWDVLCSDHELWKEVFEQLPGFVLHMCMLVHE